MVVCLHGGFLFCCCTYVVWINIVIIFFIPGVTLQAVSNAVSEVNQKAFGKKKHISVLGKQYNKSPPLFLCNRGKPECVHIQYRSATCWVCFCYACGYGFRTGHSAVDTQQGVSSLEEANSSISSCQLLPVIPGAINLRVCVWRGDIKGVKRRYFGGAGGREWWMESHIIIFQFKMYLNKSKSSLKWKIECGIKMLHRLPI